MNESSIQCRAKQCTVGWSFALLRRRAERIANQFRQACIEVDDVEQDLWVLLLQTNPKFSPAEDALAARRAIRRAAKSVMRRLRTQVAGKADRNEFVRGELTHAMRSEHETIDFAHDVAAVVAKLPWKMNRLAHFLMDESGPEIAARWAVSKASVHAMIGRIRKRFIAAGLSKKSG
jgi:hypothetical protein